MLVFVLPDSNTLLNVLKRDFVSNLHWCLLGKGNWKWIQDVQIAI